MKKLLAFLLLFAFALGALAACGRDETPQKETGDTTYECDGVSFTFPTYLVNHEELVASEASVFAGASPQLYLWYEEESVEVRLYHFTPDLLEEIGFYPDVTAADFCTIMINTLGLNEAYAEQTGSYTPLLPEEVARFRMAYFDFGDSDDGEEYYYYFLSARETDGDGLWFFIMTCPEEQRTGYSSPFRNWVQGAGLPVRTSED